MMKLIFPILFLMMPAAALAHLDGVSLTDNNYRVELGSIPAENYQIEQLTTFSLSMESVEGGHVERFGGWIRLVKGDSIIFTSTDFETQDGTLDFETTFPGAGDYEMTVRLIDVVNAREATVIFPLKVEGEIVEEVAEVVASTGSSGQGLALITLIIGLFIGGGLAILAPRWRKPQVEVEK